jgi:2-oxoglutarate ferredoxin oxidoreductase subunit delta
MRAKMLLSNFLVEEGCGECVSACPANVLEMGASRRRGIKNQVVVARPEDCLDCRACEVTCPHGAIAFP